MAIPPYWFERTSIGDDITLLTEPHVHPLLRCNIWHVSGRDHDLVIDTGLGVASLIDAADDLFGGPLLAVATHAHMDHMGGFHEFDRRAIHVDEADDATTAAGNLPLDISSYDAETVSGLASMGYDISGGLLTEVPNERFVPAEHQLVGAAPTQVLKEGDVIDLGDRAFEVLHVPGHSPGSVALLESASRTLFSGDAVYDGPLLDEIPGSDIDAYLTTMHRLRELQADTIHGGHGPSMNRSRYRELIDGYIRKRAA